MIVLFSKCRATIGLLLSVCCTNLWSLDLTAAYTQAQQQDQTYQQAKAIYEAARPQITVARAALLPQITATGSTATHRRKPTTPRRYNVNEYGVSATMPLVDYGKIQTYRQSHDTVKKAYLTFLQAEQDLILRVVTAYFNILSADQTLQFSIANETSLWTQLQQVQEKFKVGNVAGTEVATARASYQGAQAQRIADQNALATSWEALAEIIGKQPEAISTIPLKASLTGLTPKANLTDWVKDAHQHSLTIKESARQVAIDHTSRSIARAGFFPTLSGQLDYENSNQINTRDRLKTSSATLSVNYNVYQGGLTLANMDIAKHTEAASQAKLAQTQREVRQKVSSAYLSLTSLTSQRQALADALSSAEISLASTRAAYDAGTRTILDVLQQQSSLFDIQQQYSGAMFDYIRTYLVLKQTTGTLTEQDVVHLNTLLTGKALKSALAKAGHTEK